MAFAGAAASLLVLAGLLTACVAEPGTTPTKTPGYTASGEPSPVETQSLNPSASPTPTATAAALPTDCRAILIPGVLAEFGSTPLNDTSLGVPTGVQGDGSLVCIWRDPGADTTFLSTTISAKSRGPALDMLNDLAATQGFTCYTPDGGTRCEKTWQNETYPVTDGRTLFWRDDILIDTQFSNLAPPGYTAAIIASLWG